jgi:heat shock protein HslJ
LSPGPGRAGLQALLLAACTPAAPPPAAPPAIAAPPDAGALSLAGTSWRLVGFQPADAAVGRLNPSRPDEVSIAFGDDGRATFRLDCNSGSGPFMAEAAPSGTSGSLRFGTAAVTSRACITDGLADRFTRDLQNIRSYSLKGDRLFLALATNAGTYEWEPAAPQ